MIRKQDYPPNWAEISLQVRTEADWRCEWCGAANKAIIERRPKYRYYPPGMDAYNVNWITVLSVINSNNEEEFTEDMTWSRLRFFGLSKIILTVAHLDRNSKNNERSNLAALCQRCHLGHDIRQHIANRRYGRLHSKEQQLKLL